MKQIGRAYQRGYFWTWEGIGNLACAPHSSPSPRSETSMNTRLPRKRVGQSVEGKEYFLLQGSSSRHKLKRRPFSFFAYQVYPEEISSPLPDCTLVTMWGVLCLPIFSSVSLRSYFWASPLKHIFMKEEVNFPFPRVITRLGSYYISLVLD